MTVFFPTARTRKWGGSPDNAPSKNSNLINQAYGEAGAGDAPSFGDMTAEKGVYSRELSLRAGRTLISRSTTPQEQPNELAPASIITLRVTI